MTFIIGFGETEKRFEEKLEEKIRAYVTEQYGLTTDNYFSTAFINEIREWVDRLAKESQLAGDSHKTATNFPDRYAYFWATTIADASHIVFILDIHHINRRHALSPDGWALMKSERLFYVDEWEAGREKRSDAA